MFGPKPIRPVHHYILPGLFVFGLFVSIIVRSPEARKQQNYEGQIMGTYWIVKVIEGTPELQEIIQSRLNSINQKMSTYIPQSELSLFNEHASTAVYPLSRETKEVIAAAQIISKYSNGAFDISVKPLVDLWGFGPKAIESLPQDSDIALILGIVGYDMIHIQEDGIRKDVPELEIDLSSIAKGYAVDQIGLLLEEKGYHNYMVDIGGEIRAKGLNTQNRAWRIGIETPDAQRGSYTEIISLENMSIATSGDYRNYYEQDGKRISHTIDARTGRPITHALASVSVLHTSAMIADGWATALNVVGPIDALNIAKEQQLDIMLIIRNTDGTHDVQYSNHFPQYISTNNTAEE